VKPSIAEVVATPRTSNRPKISISMVHLFRISCDIKTTYKSFAPPLLQR
jgi:hypothetical protein